ncbi:DNA-3-methyladenine glycosylase family protein [Microlunatus capsulatus]|uniref:DNA-3-methyladenine glycosylase II n=1 Tax=Microlunatus capsulatus TaxID=99117 RepID=A0ABS4Z5B7_9ACTN|nr:DNA-3-methyladenine glycosylase 2 family protein [Microlunatus capsulatus]MBP2416222.1 AraC family transcriptional regulator of adaptative response / DNA-3-methyladenine glycosylase II [Microlunatus capsulatus]
MAVPGPFAGAALLDFLLRHAVAGVEIGATADDGSVRYARTLGLAHGPATLDLRWADGVLALAVDADPRDHGEAVRRVEHLVDAAAEPAVVDAHLARDPALAGLVAATPGLRVPGVLDPAEMLVRTLIGQQISLAAARTHGAALSARLGSPAAGGGPGLERLWPTPAQFAAVDPTTLPMPRARGRALVGVAERLLDGRLVLDPALDPVEARAALLACPGIGPWTADYVLMRVWHVPDVLLVSDLIIGRELAALGAADPASWSPYRSYATLHLWHAFLQRSPT